MLSKFLFAYLIEKYFIKPPPRVVTHAVHKVRLYVSSKGGPLPTMDGEWPEEWKELGGAGTATFRTKQEHIPRIPSGKDSIHFTFKSPKRRTMMWVRLKKRVRWELAAITQERPQYKKPPAWRRVWV